MKLESLSPNVNPMPALHNSDFVTQVQAQKVQPIQQAQKQEPAQDQLQHKSDDERLQQAIDQANRALQGTNRHFKYELHEKTKQVIVSVIDNNTNEVIGEFPPKKLLDAIAKLMDLAGLFVDEKA